jgi:hypothetical protein
VHFHLLVPDGVFVDDEDRLAFALHPVRRIACRLADEARDEVVDEEVEVLAQVQAIWWRAG